MSPKPVFRDIHLPGWTDTDIPVLWRGWRPRSGAQTIGPTPGIPRGEGVASTRPKPQPTGRRFRIGQWNGHGGQL